MSEVRSGQSWGGNAPKSKTSRGWPLGKLQAVFRELFLRGSPGHIPGIAQGINERNGLGGEGGAKRTDMRGVANCFPSEVL